MLPSCLDRRRPRWRRTGGSRWKHLGSSLLPPKAGLLLEGNGANQKQKRSSSSSRSEKKQYSNQKTNLQDWSGADWSNQQSNGEVAGGWSREASIEQPAPPADPATFTTIYKLKTIKNIIEVLKNYTMTTHGMVKPIVGNVGYVINSYN